MGENTTQVGEEKGRTMLSQPSFVLRCRGIGGRASEREREREGRCVYMRTARRLNQNDEDEDVESEKTSSRKDIIGLAADHKNESVKT